MNYPNFTHLLYSKYNDKDYVIFAGKHLINIKPNLKSKSRYSKSNFIYENILKNLVFNKFNDN